MLSILHMVMVPFIRSTFLAYRPQAYPLECFQFQVCMGMVVKWTLMNLIRAEDLSPSISKQQEIALSKGNETRHSWLKIYIYINISLQGIYTSVYCF